MMRSKGGKSAAAVAAAQKEPIQAGEESYRVDRQTLTFPDKLLTTLSWFLSNYVCAPYLDHICVGLEWSDSLD